jgi:hypothetical protein
MSLVDYVLNTPNLNTDSGSIIVKDWNELKQMSKKFYINAPTMNQDELDNAHKCFGLAYLSFEFPNTEIGNMQRWVEGPIIFRMVSQRYWEFYKPEH